MKEEAVKQLMFNPPVKDKLTESDQIHEKVSEAMENLLKVRLKFDEDFYIRLACMHQGLRKHLKRNECDCHTEQEEIRYERFMSAVEYALVDDSDDVDSLHEVVEVFMQEDRTVELPSWEEFVERMPEDPEWASHL